MQESNGFTAPSAAPDFNQAIQNAQATGDFDFVIDTAKKSHRMLADFRDAVMEAIFPGKKAAVIATGLNFLENLVAQAAGQVNVLKQTEKATREAFKAAATKAQKEGTQPPAPPLEVIDPEKPAEPVPAPQPGPELPPEPETPSA